MKTVTKKIDTEWFDLILAGKKKYELRITDFDIEDGDILRLEEYIGEGESRKPTGRFIEKTVAWAKRIDLHGWIEKQPDLIEKGFYVIQFD